MLYFGHSTFLPDLYYIVSYPNKQVTSKKDQAQYWADPSKPYRYISVQEISNAFKNSQYGASMQSSVDTTYDKSKSHPDALSKSEYAVSNRELFSTNFARELLLIKRHRFIYIFRTCQVIIQYLFTRLHK